MYACTNKQIHVGYSPVGKEVSLLLDETRSGFVKRRTCTCIIGFTKKKNTPQKTKQTESK